MKRNWLYVLILIVFFTLAGCGQSNSPDVSTKDHTPSERQTNEKSETTRNLSDDKAYKVIRSTLLKLDSITSKLQQRHPEWFNIAIENADEESYTDEFYNASEVFQQELKPILTRQALDKFGDGLLITYFCSCDAYSYWTVHDLKTRLMIKEQTADTFVATSLTLGNELSNIGFTNEWHFKKDDGTWKLDDYVYVSSDDQPLQLTFEDVEDYFHNEETNKSMVTLVDEVESDGASFIVVENDNNYIQAFNVDTGELNHDITLGYMESEE